MSNFKEFADEFKKFQRQLFGMVLSSFLFSTITAFAQFRRFSLDFQSLTVLVAGTVGVAGILSQFMRNLKSVHQEMDYLLSYDPSNSGANNVVFRIVLAVLMICVFYVMVVQESRWCLLPASVAAFLFFSGLTKAFQIVRLTEQQAALWRAMSQNQRDAWRAKHVQKLKARRELESREKEVFKEANIFIRESKIALDAIEESESEDRRIAKEQARQDEKAVRRRRLEERRERREEVIVGLLRRLRLDWLIPSTLSARVRIRSLERERKLEELDREIFGSEPSVQGQGDASNS